MTENAHSPVEHDHRAFLWWEADTTAVVPIEVRQVDAERLTVRGRVSHPSHDGGLHSLQRSLVVADTLYTMSEAGILASDLDSLDDRGWAAF